MEETQLGGGCDIRGICETLSRWYLGMQQRQTMSKTVGTHQMLKKRGGLFYRVQRCIGIPYPLL